MFKNWLKKLEQPALQDNDDDEQHESCVTVRGFQPPRSKVEMSVTPPEAEPASEETISTNAQFSLKLGAEPRTSTLSKFKLPEELAPLEFEQYCCDILRRLGFSAELTAVSNDHGLDIIAKRDLVVFKLRLGCQCKAYSAALVGSPEIRNFIGALAQAGLTHGIFFTTSGFSPEAKIAITNAAARGIEITLVDRASIVSLAKSVAVVDPQ